MTERIMLACRRAGKSNTVYAELKRSGALLSERKNMTEFEKAQIDFLEKNLRAIRASEQTKLPEFWIGFLFGASTAWVVAIFFLVRTFLLPG